MIDSMTSAGERIGKRDIAIAARPQRARPAADVRQRGRSTGRRRIEQVRSAWALLPVALACRCSCW